MNLRPAFVAWFMLACIAFFASSSHAQSADSCQNVGGVWYKYGITGTLYAPGTTGPVYASQAAMCSAGQSYYCGMHAPTGQCDPSSGSGIPWSPNGATKCQRANGALMSSFPGERFAQANPAVDCPATPPPGCDPIPGQAGTKFTASDWRDISASPGDFCSPSTNCKVKMRQATQIGGGSVWTMEYTADECSVGAEEGPEDADTSAGESCTAVGSGEYCASPSGEGDCGYLNDKFICLSSVPDKGCKYMADGAGVCDSEAETPPKPDSGTPGTPATPDDTIETDTRDDSGNPTGGGGGCGAGCDYYDPATVDGSARDPTDTGGGTGGGVNVGGAGGGGDGEGDDLGEVVGPAVDDAECDVSGCAQSFYDRVMAAPIIASVASVGSSIPGGSCPSYTLEAFGEEYSLSQPMCDIWDSISTILSALFLVLWAWIATRIVLSA